MTSSGETAATRLVKTPQSVQRPRAQVQTHERAAQKAAAAAKFRLEMSSSRDWGYGGRAGEGRRSGESAGHALRVVVVRCDEDEGGGTARTATT
ncbi:hypothetical protein PsYK624_169380 [Phanerochaete sordida]|uniref:Uncharacterized protein n=1 Tax=Phanerochaete sordida TaxID=48140 RepID=A0A9P3GSE5_9APHY|nr:hypothetical protein PsYK624_169380 [Phanerochaete sordida]